MSNQIHQPPNHYDFGLNFNYAVWGKDTVLSLVDVPWNNDYRDIVKFDSREKLNTYIDSLVGEGIQVTNMSYLKPNEPVRVNIPFNKAYKYNYLRAHNPLQPIPGGDVQRDFYYFITDVRYLAPNTTELVVQLDVWQTFGFDVRFGQCYIERGHVGIANENQFQNYGREYLTIPEGIDTGSEYQIIARKSEDIMGMKFVDNGTSLEFDERTGIIVISSVDLESPAGDVSNPILTSATGSHYETGNGATYYAFSSKVSFMSWLDATREKPWVTQGILAAFSTPLLSRYIPRFTYADHGIPKRLSDSLLPLSYRMFDAWRSSNIILSCIPVKYQHLKKFFTFPYMFIEATTWTGNPITIKPELWRDENATLIERATFMAPNQRIEFAPRNYNSRVGAVVDNYMDVPDRLLDQITPEDAAHYRTNGDDGGEYWDMSTKIANLPSMAVVNNGHIGYLASNKNVLGYQRESADWTQQRALQSNRVGYDQASSAMNLANELTGIGISADQQLTGNSNRVMAGHAVVNGIGGIVSGAAGGIGGGVAGVAMGAAGGALSAAQGGINAAISIGGNDEALRVRNAAAAQSNTGVVGNKGYVRDTNKDLADFAARGDYQNTIAGINAKVNDSKMIQPSVSGQQGGESLNLSNNNVEIALRWKMVDTANMRIIGDYWLRYGYAVQQFALIPESLMVMTNFTYWKLTETYLTAATMPETFKQAIRGIFEKGVTVWAKPGDIGVIKIEDNKPLTGIRI